jgi:UDPglucose 6-dehydrogenase
LSIIEALTQSGTTVTAYDPEAMQNVKAQIGDKIKYAENQYQALEGAAALIIATEWSEFKSLDYGKIKKLLNEKIIFDGRNIYEINTMRKHRFTYYSIGRQEIK